MPLAYRRNIPPVMVRPIAAPPIAERPVSPDFDVVLSRLTPRQRKLFHALHPYTNDEFRRGREIADQLGLSGADSVSNSMAGLRRRLNDMNSEYRVQVRAGLGGGYRLIIDESRL